MMLRAARNAIGMDIRISEKGGHHPHHDCFHHPRDRQLQRIAGEWRPGTGNLTSFDRVVLGTFRARRYQLIGHRERSFERACGVSRDIHVLAAFPGLKLVSDRVDPPYLGPGVRPEISARQMKRRPGYHLVAVAYSRELASGRLHDEVGLFRFFLIRRRGRKLGAYQHFRIRGDRLVLIGNRCFPRPQHFGKRSPRFRSLGHHLAEVDFGKLPAEREECDDDCGKQSGSPGPAAPLGRPVGVPGCPEPGADRRYQHQDKEERSTADCL